MVAQSIVGTVVIVVALFVLLGVIVGYMVLRNTKKPESERKWTDPKFHD